MSRREEGRESHMPALILHNNMLAEKKGLEVRLGERERWRRGCFVCCVQGIMYWLAYVCLNLMYDTDCYNGLCYHITHRVG